MFIYDGLQATTAANPPAVVAGTTLTPPYDTLSEVFSVAAVGPGPELYFGSGRFTTGTPYTGVIEEDANAAWSVPQFMAGLSGDDFAVASAVEVGQSYLCVAVAQYNQNTELLFKVRISDGVVVNGQTLPFAIYDVQIRADQRGNLYVGSQPGLVVYDTSGNTGFQVITSRPELQVGRFGLEELGSSVRVFYTAFRSSLVIGTTDVLY